jgi:spermidine synthase
MTWVFAFFFISGFCSILYELIWLRLAMAQYGVTTALTSIVLSAFMAGLGLGSLGAGFLIRRYARRLRSRPIQLYSLTELVIGISALAVPLQLAYGHHLIVGLTGQRAISSLTHYLASGVLLAVIIVPWCSCMGATIPFAMFAIRSAGYESHRSFSFLYLSNVLGAVAGATISPLLVELYGLHTTLRIGAVLNTAIAASAFLLSFVARRGTDEIPAQNAVFASGFDLGQTTLLLLFLTGLTSMGMELVWIRLFTPYVGAVVYSFAGILASYLVATFFGSRVYRGWHWGRRESNLAWVALVPLGMLPLLAADARFGVHFNPFLRVFCGVAPFSALLGFLTPLLVDRWSRGDPERAGHAYAVNVFGCILGPLICGFLLLPFLGERGAIIVLSLPWAALMFWSTSSREPRFRIYSFATVALGVAILFSTRDVYRLYPESRVLRDNTATVIATGSGREKKLLVNGIGMTQLWPVTKMMAHLTMSSLDHDPRNALIICFGMGTTFKSVMSWGIPTTVVDLVPSVPPLFSYFHPDSATLVTSPRAHVVVDDGRRFLERSRERYDLIIIDPPPPVQAAGSSLLYSEEFYALAKQHLNDDGILQQWLPEGDNEVKSSVTRAIQNSFPYLRIFQNELGKGHGWHYLASSHPIPNRTAKEMVSRMPASAVIDMMEWGPETTADQQIQQDLAQEVSPSELIALSPQSPSLSDDKPVNEYYLLRETTKHWLSTKNKTIVAIRELLAQR